MILTDEHLDFITRTARQYGARTLILFGSTIENPAEARDLDLAVDIRSWDIFAFAADVEERLHVTVDVVPLEPSNAFVELIKQRGTVLYAA
jgi:predicted nucleotidyltransferase